MSDGVITHPKPQRMSLLREDYFALCEGNDVAAKALNVLERWHATKLKHRGQAKHRRAAAKRAGETSTDDIGLWVFMSVEDMQGELMGVHSYKPVKAALQMLVDKGFVERRNNPHVAFDRKPQFLFKVTAVQAAVNAWDAARPKPNLEEDPDGEAPEGDGYGIEDDSVNLAESSRQKGRMDTSDVPNGDGQSTETTRQKDRSNTTGFPTPVSSPGFQPQVVSPGAPLGTAGTTTTGEDQEGDPAGEGEAAALRAFGVAPDGAGADAPEQGEGLDRPDLDRSQAPKVTDTPTEGRKVPAAARDPEAAAKLLAPKLGGVARFEGFLQEAPPSGVKRAKWLDLPLSQIEQLLVTTDEQVALAKAEGKKPNAWTLLLRALDEAIGASVTKGGNTGAATRVTNDPAPAAQTHTVPGALTTGEHNPRLEIGARYRRRSDGAELTIEGTEVVKTRNGEGGRFRVGGALVTGLDLLTKFEYLEPVAS